MMRKLLLGTAALAVIAVMAVAPAHASFIKETDFSSDVKYFIDVANKSKTDFGGNVGGNGFGPVVKVHTVGAVDTGSGYANIVPVKGGTLTDIIFTPLDDTQFSDFSFRGQFAKLGYVGDLSITVTDQNGLKTTVAFGGLAGPDADFGRIGVVSKDGETIKAVEINVVGGESFKELKQIDFSFAPGVVPPPPPPGVPEPISLGLFGLGLLGIGTMRKLRG